MQNWTSFLPFQRFQSEGKVQGGKEGMGRLRCWRDPTFWKLYEPVLSFWTNSVFLNQFCLFEPILSTSSRAPSLLYWLKGLKSNQRRVCLSRRNIHGDLNVIYGICGSKNNNKTVLSIKSSSLPEPRLLAASFRRIIFTWLMLQAGDEMTTHWKMELWSFHTNHAEIFDRSNGSDRFSLGLLKNHTSETAGVTREGFPPSETWNVWGKKRHWFFTLGCSAPSCKNCQPIFESARSAYFISRGEAPAAVRGWAASLTKTKGTWGGQWRNVPRAARNPAAEGKSSLTQRTPATSPEGFFPIKGNLRRFPRRNSLKKPGNCHDNSYVAR